MQMQGADSALVAGCLSAIEGQETLAGASRRMRTGMMDAAVAQAKDATRAEGALTKSCVRIECTHTLCKYLVHLLAEIAVYKHCHWQWQSEA